MPVDTPCPLCNNRVHNNENCSFDFQHESTMTIDDLLTMVDREVQIVVNFPATKDLPFEVDFGVYEFKDSISKVNLDHESSNKSKMQTVQDSLEAFQKEELLGGADKWFCCKCNQYVAATKQIQLFKMPQCLIIHLKRFWHQKSRSSSGTTTKKINKLIDFPLDDLDLSAYCSQLASTDSTLVTSPAKQSPKLRYELYAISNHYGSLSSGHYTAFGKSPLNGLWYEYNDSKVKQVSDTKSLVSEAAYLLFY